MGGSSSTQQQTSQTQQTQPYWQAQQPLNNILGQIGGIPAGPSSVENTALNNLVTLGQAGNPYAAGVGNVANSLLSGGPDRTGIASDAYNRFQSQMMPTAQGNYLDPNTNPFFGATTSGVFDRAMEGLNKSYAAAGMSPTGAGSYGQQLGDTVTNALAPYFMQQYNTERQNQLGGINSLFGAGTQTAGLLGGLDAQRAATQQAGISAAQEATGAQNWGDMQVLAAEAQRRGIPLGTLAAQMGIVLPAAQAFGTTTSTGTGTTDKNMSGAEQFGLITGGLGKLWGSK